MREKSAALLLFRRGKGGKGGRRRKPLYLPFELDWQQQRKKNENDWKKEEKGRRQSLSLPIGSAEEERKKREAMRLLWRPASRRPGKKKVLL